MLSFFPKIAAQLAHETKTKTKGEIVTTLSTAIDCPIVAPQPLKANELELLEQGERDYNYLVTWLSFPIATTDRLYIAGTWYRVHQIDDRGEFSRVVIREIVANVA
jgi:cytochrome c biogenesis factor